MFPPVVNNESALAIDFVIKYLTQSALATVRFLVMLKVDDKPLTTSGIVIATRRCI